MKDAYSTLELQEILSVSDRTVFNKAKRESWQSRPRKGRGGGNEWLVASMPEQTRLAIAAKVCPAENGPVPLPAIAEGDAMTSLAEKARRRAEARAAVTLAARAYCAASDMAYTPAMSAFATTYNEGGISVAPWVRETLPTIGRSSIMRWDAKAREKGASALAGKYGHRKGTGKVDSQENVINTVLGMISQYPDASVHVIHENLQALAHDGWAIDVPSLRRLQQWVANWKAKNRQTFLFLTAPDRWRGQYQSATGSAYELVTRYNQRWEYDGTPADLMLADGKRYTIVGVINVYSRELKLEVTERSTGRAVANLTRRALLDWGVPEEAVTDNGKEFVGNYMQSIFLDLGITPNILPPFRPDMKGAIERSFRTFSHDLIPIFNGYLGHNVATRQAIRERETFAKRLMQKGTPEKLSMDVTPERLQEFCDDWTDNKYRHRPHAGLGGKTPWERRQSWTGEIRRIAPEQERALDVLLMDCGFQMVTKKGIRFDGMRYDHAALGIHAGQMVAVRVDPADRRQAFVFDEAGEFLCKAVEVSGLAADEVAALAKEKRQAQRNFVRNEKKRLTAAAEATGATGAVDRIMRMHRDRAAEIEAESAMQATVVTHDAPALTDANEAVNSTVNMMPDELRAENARAVARKAMAAPAETGWLPESTPEKYRLYKALKERLAAGEEVPAEQRDWMARFEQTSAYRGFMMAEGVKVVNG